MNEKELIKEFDKKLNAAIVSLKQDFDETIDAVLVDNFELSQKIKALDNGLGVMADNFNRLVKELINRDKSCYGDTKTAPIFDMVKALKNIEEAAKKMMKRVLK